MLILRKKQMEALSEYMISQFEDRMLTHLRQAFPQATAKFAEDEFSSIIPAGIEKAKTYGVVLESDVKTFLEYVALYGLGFDSNQEPNEVSGVLRDKSLNSSEKMDILYRLRQEKEGERK